MFWDLLELAIDVTVITTRALTEVVCMVVDAFCQLEEPTTPTSASPQQEGWEIEVRRKKKG
jgi:hypothetical protein